MSEYKGYTGQIGSEAEAQLPKNDQRVTWCVRPDKKPFLKFSDGSIVFMTDGTDLDTRLTYIENNEIKIPYFEIIDISSATAGVLTIPTGATISLDEFKFAEDAVLSTLSGTQPNFESPLSGGTPIGVTLDGLGNWTVSGNYGSLVALIYVVKIKLVDFQNLDEDKYLPLDETSFQKENVIIPGTASQYWRGDKTWQDLPAAVRAVLLTGIVFTDNNRIIATDSILVAFGKIQRQLNERVIRKYLNIADELINFNAVSAAFTNFFSTIISANDPDVEDGRELILEVECIVNKTTLGNTTYEVEFNIGGISIVTSSFTIGAGTIANQTWKLELRINFRAGNLAKVYSNFRRENTTSGLSNFTPTLADIAFNKTIANTISLGVRVVSNATNNNLTRKLTSLIIK